MIIAQLHQTCPAMRVTIWLLLCFRTEDEILLDNVGHVWRDKFTAIIATIVTTPPHTHTVVWSHHSWLHAIRSHLPCNPCPLLPPLYLQNQHTNQCKWTHFTFHPQSQ